MQITNFKKIFTLTSVVVGTGTSLFYLLNDSYSLSHVGIVRFTRAGLTACSTIIDYKITLRGLDQESIIYKEKILECHQRGAERFLSLARKNGGVFIKVGQHIAALQYLLPEPYTKTLSILHSKAPESTFDEINRVFKSSLHKDIKDVFDNFDMQPCGTASLAQVHKCRLKSNGDIVAVKIQHPYVKERSSIDMETMEFFVNIASIVFPNLKLKWLVNETKQNLPKELDFLHEASNAERARKMFEHLPFVKIPKIYNELSTDSVLVMEFCEGGQINDLDYFYRNKLNKHKVCRMLGKLYSEMIFTQGYIHSDPHPGNVLVRRSQEKGEEELILLDHGLYVTLPDELRIDYAKLWLSLLKADREEIRRISERMNVGEYYGLFACIVSMRSWKSVTEGIAQTKLDEQERSHIQEFAATLIPQISVLLDSIPRQMLLVLKTNDLLRSIAYRLKAEHRLDSFTEMAKYCTKAVYKHSINDSHFLVNKIRLYLAMYFMLAKITFYEYFLIVNGLFL